MHERTEIVDTANTEGLRPRGPLRPENLLSTRQRQSRRLAAHRFRALDTLFLLCTTFFFLRRAPSTPTLETPLADVIPALTGAWLVWMLVRSMGLYRLARSERLARHLGRLVIAIGIAAAAAALLRWVLPGDETDVGDTLGLMLIIGVGMLVLHTTWFGLIARRRRLGWLTPNIVVVGATEHAEDLISSALQRRDLNILGIFDDRPTRSPLAVLGVPVLGTTADMLDHRVMPYVDLIVVTIDPSATTRVREIMTRLSVLPNKVTLLFDDPSALRRATAIDQLADAPLAPLHPATDAARRAFAKRVQDLAISIPLLVLVAPVLGLIALAIRLDSPGPIFFRQRRHGFNNEEIVVCKFRSMRHDAADARAERQVTAGDDRVTRVGRILRSTSLDELPQLFNVITGEMSLVGPRPHAIGMKTRDVESAKLVAEYAHRHRIKPGMTGWAAINGSRGPLHDRDEVSRRVALDVDYIERQSFWLDLQIMVMTIPSMFGDRHAIR